MMKTASEAPGPPGTSAASAAAALASKTATDGKNHRVINSVGRMKRNPDQLGNLKPRAPTTGPQDDGSCSECNCKLFATRLAWLHPKPCGARRCWFPRLKLSWQASRWYPGGVMPAGGH